MSKQLNEKLKIRWVKIEDRLCELTTILMNLEELEEECKEINVKSTIAYMLAQQELRLLNDEQSFVESAIRATGGFDAGLYKGI